MSVIAVKGIPPKWSLMNVVKVLAKAISGNFEALNFKQGFQGGKFMKTKTCYLRLSEKLDPVRVVEKINSSKFPKQFRPIAFIPDYVPDIPLAAKPKKMPQKMRQKLKVVEELVPEKIVSIANMEILAELQFKYPKLYHISAKIGHRLLEELAKKICERLKEIVERNKEVSTTCFKLSQCYRRMHPHFGDFQLVLSTLHALEDAAGTPRTQLQEAELSAAPPNPRKNEQPNEKVLSACNKYTDRVFKTISEHVKNLKSEVVEGDTEDEIVRKKVAEEMKKMTPFLSLIVKQVVMKQFVQPKVTQYSRVRIYGEPFLPGKDTMAPFLYRYRSVRIDRSERMFNLLRFNIPPANYASLMAMDGTVLNGAKLVIRTSDLPTHRVSAAFLSGNPNEEPDEGLGEEPAEDWNNAM